jgi:hypothetical protein
MHYLLIGIIDNFSYFWPSVALKSLQGIGGAYCLVTPGRDHVVRGGNFRNFNEGDNIRVIRPKESRAGRKRDKDNDVHGLKTERKECGHRHVGYGLKLTFDLPQGKAVGKLKIRACWHDIVFRNEFGFTERMFLYT